MDILGLFAFGVPDLQIHAHSLPRNQLTGWLFDAAQYIFDRAEMVSNGHTTEGL
jgi:hypothetical protein